MRETSELTIQSGSWTRNELLMLRILGTGAFAFLTVLAAQVRIPLPFTPVPMTLQTFVVPLAGGFLGATWGSASILLYLALGIVGIPVFANAATGVQMVTAPTAGFLMGFVVAAWVVGFARDRKAGNGMLFVALLAAHILIFAFGFLGYLIGAGVGAQEAMAMAVTPFLVGDVIKITASYMVLLSFKQFRKFTHL